MKAFTVHDVFKIAQFTEAPCIAVYLFHSCSLVSQATISCSV